MKTNIVKFLRNNIRYTLDKGRINMREWTEIQVLFADNKTPKEICVLRTEYAMKWYIERAIWNKQIYYIFSFIGMLCPLVNAVFAVCVECKVLTVILSSITSLAASLLALTNARLKWENYRSAAEFLKREFTLYQARAGAYAGEQREEIYLCTIEAFMQQTHVNWQKIFEKDDSEDEKE